MWITPEKRKTLTAPFIHLYKQIVFFTTYIAMIRDTLSKANHFTHGLHYLPPRLTFDNSGQAKDVFSP